MINNIWLLISKKLNNEASPEELEELAQLIKEDTEGIYPMDLLEYIGKNSFSSSDQENQPTKEKWELLKTMLADSDNQDASVLHMDNNAPANKTPIYKYALLIAASLLVICSGAFLLNNRARHSDSITQITAPRGAISNIQLPDGSKVVLNSGSKISYNNSFNSEHRELYLSGEAFFDVVKDAKHPFIVTTQTIRIKVLGTRFNVRSYPNDKTSEASLLRGSIELTVLRNPDRQIILKPTEKLTVTNVTDDVISNPSATHKNKLQSIELSQIHEIKQDSLPVEAIWMENKIVFDGLEFEDIAKMMERKYNVSFEFKNERIRKLKFTGKFQNLPLDVALRQLQIIEKFNFKINTNQVIIN